MATTDILSQTEALRAVNYSTASGDTLAEIVQMNTRVSADIDRLCGPVVQRTVTDEVHTGVGTRFYLRQLPVVSVSSVTEYVAGVGTVLTAEDLDTAGGYLLDLDLGVIDRRSTFYAHRWDGRIAVTYVAGRFANTAAVTGEWKGRAAAALRRLWREESPLWARTTEFTGVDDEYPGLAYNDAFLRSVLGGSMRPPAVA